MGQDVLLHRNLLFMMPLVSEKGPKAWNRVQKAKEWNRVLVVYDVASGREKADHQWPQGHQRQSPMVYKESGEKRLYAYEEVLLQIVPADVWTLMVYRIQPEEKDVLTVKFF